MSDNALDEYHTLVRACVAFAREATTGPFDSSQLQEETATLEHQLGCYWRAFAQTLAGALPDTETEDEYPGYINIKFDSLVVRVPAHLITYFPSSDVTEEICKLGKKVQRADNSVICISGSSTFSKAYSHVGDIDYCEYVEHDDETLANGLIDAPHLSTADLCTYRISASGNDWSRPWPAQWKPNPKSDQTFMMAIKDVLQAACDFIAITKCAGTVEATDRILVIDAHAPDKGMGMKSFPAQEAPITSGDWVPRTLASPLMCGTYVHWLIQAIADEELGIVKRMKRSLSLALMLQFADLTNSLLDVIESTDALRLEAIKTRQTLLKHLKDTNDPALATFISSLTMTIRELINGTGNQEDRNSLSDDNHSHLTAFEGMVKPIIKDIHRLAVQKMYG